MALMNKKLSSAAIDDKPLLEEIVQPRKSIFTALVPEARINTMLKYIEGANWQVNYYGQINNENTTIEHIDIKQANLSQSYIEIIGMNLKVSSALSFNYENGISSMTGTSTVPMGIYPNAGDVFVANVDTGEDAVFIITQVERLTHRKDTLYSIDYTMFAYTNDNEELVKKLKERVNETYHYDNYIDSRNKNVLITDADKKGIDNIRSFLYQSQQEYFKLFDQITGKTIAIPGLDIIAYDAELTHFIHHTVNTSDITGIQFYPYTIESIDYRRNSILTHILEIKFPKSKRIQKFYNFINADAFWRKGSLRGFRYAGVELVCHPIEPDRNMLSDPETIADETITDIRNDKNYYNEDFFETTVTGLNGPVSKPILHKLFEDNYYVVSENFYKYLEDPSNANDVSLVELLIYKHLKRETIDISEINRIIEDWEDWSYLHQFYLLPVIWAISKRVIGMV